jgi:DNA-binding MarR family transcriptional regulator
MGRRSRIEPGARGTTISLTPAQKSCIRKLQTKRLEEGKSEPLLNEVILEGLKMLCEKEGWSPAELERVFPKWEAPATRVKVFPKRARKHGPR